jgi:hypothetical protein
MCKEISCAAGDQIGHLHWRLLHGGQTPKLAPRVAVMLIGTNDFGAVDMCFGDGTDDLQAATGVNSRRGTLSMRMRSFPQLLLQLDSCTALAAKNDRSSRPSRKACIWHYCHSAHLCAMRAG